MKTCLVGGGRAGSSEHVFPASFGGKRVNNGIYCEVHNNELGRHVTALLKDLDIVNAIIGVIPDKKSEIRPAEISSDNGARYLLTKDSIEVALPRSIKETPELIGTQTTIAFRNEADIAKWIENQKKDGYDVKVLDKGTLRSELFTKPLGRKINLGGPEFKRGLIYLGLTYLAHYYPKVARDPQLSDARNLIMDDMLPMSDDRVLWQSNRILDQFNPNPFRHGHTIVIGQITGTNQIGAFICFYGLIQFGVRLGSHSDLPCNIRYTTHIDPLATTMPSDIVEIKDEGATFELCDIEESDLYLKSVISDPEKSPFSALMRTASDERLQSDCQKVLPDLLKLAGGASVSITDGVMQILNSQDQRILNLLKYAIEDFSASTQNQTTANFSAILNALITSDEMALRGIGISTEAVIHLAKFALAEEITKQIVEKNLTADSLSDLLGQGVGAAIAFKSVVFQIFEMLKSNASTTII